MQRLKKIGDIKAKKSSEIKNSKIGIGFEKLDRNVFDPKKAYDKLAGLGVKWVRIQSGWQRTEREKGKYDFAWIDSIVDNLLERGLKPWICLCYGNELYDENAAKVFGAVGCPPIHTEEQRQAWANYVKAIVTHYKGKIEYYEVWNEPDGPWCWKHGVSGTELGNFTIATSKAAKEADPDVKIIGGVICNRNIAFINEAFSTGMGDHIDALSFHEYTCHESRLYERVRMLKALINQYNPKIKLIQGESGSQSRSGGHGALHAGGWTPKKQAKQLARHTMADLFSGVEFMSYFSCVDMIEALNGLVDNKSSYLDYGYFGVLGADFDENGFSTGEYSPKPSYRTLQVIASMFSDDCVCEDVPVLFSPCDSPWIFENDTDGIEASYGGFKKSNGSAAYVYWKSTNIMTTDFCGTVTLQAAGLDTNNIKLVDILDGSVYEIPEEMIERDTMGCIKLMHIPIKDTPLALTFGNFCDFE